MDDFRNYELVKYKGEPAQIIFVPNGVLILAVGGTWSIHHTNEIEGLEKI
jgi:hypothetical protein